MSDQEKREFKISGQEIVDKIKEWIKEGNSRKIVITTAKDKKIGEVSLTYAVAGAAAASLIAGAFAVKMMMKKHHCAHE